MVCMLIRWEWGLLFSFGMQECMHWYFDHNNLYSCVFLALCMQTLFGNHFCVVPMHTTFWHASRIVLWCVCIRPHRLTLPNYLCIQFCVCVCKVVHFIQLWGATPLIIIPMLNFNIHWIHVDVFACHYDAWFCTCIPLGFVSGQIMVLIQRAPGMFYTKFYQDQFCPDKCLNLM